MELGRQKKIAFPLIVIALSLAIYCNTLPNGFAFDDYREIVNNPLIKSFDGKEFLRAYLPGPGKPEPPGRPIPLLTFTLNFILGGLNPWSYHLVNLILNAAVSLLIYLVCLELFPGKTRFSFLTAALFACHPIHSEIVAAAVGRAELISSFCFLAVLLIYLRITGSDYSPRSSSYWLTLPILLIGALSKGTSFTLPFTIMAFDLYRFTIREGKSFHHALSVFTYRLKKFYLYYLIVIFGTFAFYSEVPRADILGANFMVFLSFGERIPACLGILARYIFLLVWPFRLSSDYSYSQLSYLPEYIRNLWIGGGIAAILAGITLAVISLRNKGHYFLAVFIFAVNYVIISNLLVVINVSMAERLIYMASLGFCLALGLVLESALVKSQDREGLKARSFLIWILIVAILAAYSVRTWTRNRDWKDNFTLFSAAYEACPMSCRVNYNLGLEYSQRGRLDKAIFHYGNAARIVGWNPLYHLNLGEAYASAGRTDEAIEEFRKVVRLEPERVGGYINLASACLSKGLADQAVQYLSIAGEIAPDNWRVHYNMGNAYMAKGEWKRAVKQYRRSLDIRPDHWEAWNRLGAVHLKLGAPREAIRDFREAIRCFPGCKEAYNNLGLAYAELGEEEEAVRSFKGALAIDPRFSKARNNLGRMIKKQ